MNDPGSPPPAQAPGGPPASDAIFGRAAMAAQLQDPGLIVEVLRLFRREAASAMTELRRLVGTGQDEAVARVAHRLKGSLHALYAARALDAASALEAIAKGRRPGAAEALAALEGEMTLLAALVDRAVADLEAGAAP